MRPIEDGIETVADDCKHKDCVYRGHISPINRSTPECCDYLILTGKPRGCSISKCDKYKRGKRKMTRNFSTGVIKWTVDD